MTTIIAATDNGLFDAETMDASAMEGHRVDALSPDGRWAVVARREIWTQVDDRWTHVTTTDPYELNCVCTFGDDLLVGTSEAHLLQLRGDRLELVEPFESVKGRDEWFTPWGGPPDVRSIAARGSEVYVNVHVGGIVRGDGRTTWEPTVDISTDVHEVRAVDDLVVAACAVGFAESEDGGTTWHFNDAGLHATYARAVAADDTNFYMSVAHGPRGGDAAIYRKARGRGDRFARCALPSFRDNIDSGCLDADNGTVAFGTRTGEVFASTDRGTTWLRVADGLPAIHHLRVDRDA